MVSRSFIEMVKGRWREFRREPSAFFWVMFLPLLWMVALGLAFSNPQPEIYGVATSSAEVMMKIDSDKGIKASLVEENEFDRMFKRGSILLRVDKSLDLYKFVFDNKNPEARRAYKYVNNLLQVQAGRTDPLKTEIATISSKGQRYIDFLIPGLLGLSVMTSSLFGVAMTFVANRRENLLKRYLATPMKKFEFLLSHVVGRMMVLAFEFATVMVAGWLIFDFTVVGSFLSFVIFTILGTASFTAMAILFGSRTRSISTVSGITNLASMTMMMMCGVFFSKNNFPDWMLSFIDLLPLTALNDGLRKIALEGASLMSLGPEMILLSIYFVVCVVVSRFIFRWY